MATFAVIGFIMIIVKLVQVVKAMPQDWWKMWKRYDKKWWKKWWVGILNKSPPQEPEQRPLLDGP